MILRFTEIINEIETALATPAQKTAMENNCYGQTTAMDKLVQ